MMFSFPCPAQPAPVVLDSTFHFKSIQAPEDIHIDLNKMVFTKESDGRLNFGFSPREYCYIVLKVMADKPLGTYELSIDNTSLDSVQVFSWLPGERKLLYRGGNLMNYRRGRDYVWHTFSLDIDRVPHFYLIAVKALSKNVNLQYRIMKPAELRRLYRSFDRIISFYAGITLFIIGITLFAFLLLRIPALLLYTGYLLSVTSWILSHYGYLFPLVYPSFPRMNDVVKIVSSLLAVVFFLCLILSLFKREIRASILKRIVIALIGLNILFICIVLLHLVFIFKPAAFTGINIAWHVLLVVSACAAVPLLFSLFSAGRSAKLFCLAAACPFIMLFIQIFSNAGSFRDQFLNNHGVLLANLLEIFIILSGIIYNLWDKERLRDKQLRLLEEDRRETLKKLIMVQDYERKRIAEELHDSIGPLLAAIRINFLRAVKAEREHRRADLLVAKTENIIDDSIGEIRNIAHQLMPKGLSSKGLVTLLSEYFDDLQNIYPATIDFESDIALVLPGETQLNLYRIISELVLNAAKHGQAKVIAVSLKAREQEIHVLTLDDGTGFNVDQKAQGLGLKSIESRVSYLKGAVDIRSSAETGSCIKITIPYKHN